MMRCMRLGRQTTIYEEEAMANDSYRRKNGSGERRERVGSPNLIALSELEIELQYVHFLLLRNAFSLLAFERITNNICILFYVYYPLEELHNLYQITNHINGF